MMLGKDHTNEQKAAFMSVVERYACVEGSLITILQQTQDIFGYLPEEALKEISKQTKIPFASIKGVATFYAQFRFQPTGEYMLLLCSGTACHVNGSEGIRGAVIDYLNIKDGETTPDGLFTLKTVACLGCCSLSPVMMINDTAYGNLTKEKAVKILKEIQNKTQTEAAK